MMWFPNDQPDTRRAWRHVRNTGHFVSSISADDHQMWLRQLDDDASLHERLVESPTYMSTNCYRAVAAGHPAR
jgi:hypothetical protein